MRPGPTLFVVGAATVALRAGAQSPGASAEPARAGRSSLNGSVFDSLLANRPLAGATVWLVGTSRSAVSNERGSFRFDSIPPGRYTLAFSEPSLDSMGVSPPTVDVIAGDGAALVVQLATPSPAAFYANACGAARVPDVGAVFGIVRDAERAAPVGNAQVTAEWVEWVLAGSGLQQSDAQIGVSSDAEGRYRLCGVPSDVAVLIRARSGGSASGSVEIDMAGRPFAIRDLGITTMASDRTAPSGTAALVGTTTGSDGRPVSRAQVSVLGVAAPVALTDSAGAFSISGLPAGTHTLEARALGFAPMHVAVDLRPGRATRVTARFDRRVVVLTRERILARGPSGFADRRRRGSGDFIDRERIERSNAVDLNDVLRASPRLAVSAGSASNPASRRSAGRCAPSYYVDGVELSPGGVLTADHTASSGSYIPPGGTITPGQIITARDIDAVEVYGEASAPMRAGRSSGCGALMIWTRDSLPDRGARRANNRQ